MHLLCKVNVREISAQVVRITCAKHGHFQAQGIEGISSLTLVRLGQTGRIYTNIFAYLMTISKVVELMREKEENNLIST